MEIEDSISFWKTLCGFLLIKLGGHTIIKRNEVTFFQGSIHCKSDETTIELRLVDDDNISTMQ